MKHQHLKPRLTLPPVPADAVVEKPGGCLRPCWICEAVANAANPEMEYQCNDGLVSMSTDTDLCLECAIWFSRAFQHFMNRPAADIQWLLATETNARERALSILAEYPPTQAEVTGYLTRRRNSLP